MVASVINQKRFERLEQQLGGIVDAERAGRCSRMMRRNSCKTRSAPATSSPRSRLRSSSPISSERAPGESSRRNCRSRSTVVSAPAMLGLSEFKPLA
jgi:hypothetical protein